MHTPSPAARLLRPFFGAAVPGRPTRAPNGSAGLCVLLWLATLAGVAPPAKAEGFVFTLDNAALLPGTGQALVNAFYPQATAAGLGSALASQLELQLAPDVTSLAQQIRDEVNGRLGPIDFSHFLHNSANAAALAAKAMPVDYASGIRIFSLSLGGGGAVGGTQYLDGIRHPQRTIDNISAEPAQSPHAGVAAEVAVSLGIHMGAFRLPKWRYFDPRRLELYVSAFVLPLHSSDGSWAVKSKTFGGYAKYQLIKERALVHRNIFLWHGLNVITGLGYTGTNLQISTNLPASTATQQFVSQGQSLDVTASWSGDAKIGANMGVYSIPIEVASALQLVYALTLYGGAALDFNIGKANLNAQADAPVTIAASKPGNANQVVVSQPEPSLTYALQRKANVVDVRGFAGLQINAGVLALFAQISGDSHRAAGLHAGLRGFW